MKKCPSTLHYLLLLTLPMFATAFAQGPSPLWNPRAARPLEKYDNPPAYIYRLETSPRMISPHGVFISYQVNVDANGNNIVGDAANECAIIDSIDSHPAVMQQIAELANQRPGINQQAADADAALRQSHAPGDLGIDFQTAARRKHYTRGG